MKRWITYSIFISCILSGISHDALAQDNLEQELINYYATQVPLKIHITFNQPAYAPGDTIYYSGWLLTANDLRPIAGRQIIKVILQDQQSNEILHTQILARDGRFSNQLIIPAGLRDGLYRIVAFNNWMRNAGQDYFFQQFMPISADKIPFLSAKTASWSFFPEGGSLISNVSNKVVVQGKPETDIQIRNEENELISSLQTDVLGFGSFFIKPDKAKKYLLYVQGEENPVSLPSANDKGISIQLLESRERFDLIIQANDNMQAFKLLVHAHDDLIYLTDLNFNQNSSRVFRFNKSDLPISLIRVAIIDDQYTVHHERLFVHYPEDLNIQLNADKKVYQTREKVALDLSIGDNQSEGISSYTLKIYKQDYFTEQEEARPMPYALLALADIPVNAANIGIRSQIRNKSQMDNFLITQNWQRFGMHDLKSNRKSAEFLFESYLQLSGAVNIPGNNQDSVLISMYLQKNQDVYEVYAKDSGEFNAALLFDVYEDEEVLVTAYRRPNILKQVEINQAETYQPQLFHFDFAYRDSENAYAMYSNKKSKIDKAFYFDENKYLSVGRENENPNTKIEKSIDGFDEVVNFNEYYIFPSMQETIHEIIPHLQVRKQNQREILRVYIKELERSGSSDPLLIIDGVMTNDIDFFLNLNPSSVMRVSLINSLKKMEYFGVIGRNGIVVVDTKIPGHAAQVPRPSNTFNLMGLSKSVEFPLKQSPNSVQNRMPDIRSTLYWNGLGKTNEKGEAGISFFCSDDTGFYKVIAEGFTASGLPFHVETDFEVVFKTEQ